MLKLFNTKKRGLIITGDETWINYNNPSGPGWIIPGEEIEPEQRQTFLAGKADGSFLFL